MIGGGHLAPVARRWKTQLNENAKTWAMWDELPELAHNSIVGLRGAAGPPAGDPGDRPPRHREPPRRRPAGGRSSRSWRPAGRPTTEVIGLEPDLPLAEAFAGVILGDWVSYHLAMALEVDPTPVEAINRYKAKLAGP